MSTEYEERITKRTQVYRALGQGLKVFHEHERPEVDFLAVPGLGTNPEECWTWTPSRKEDSGRARQSTVMAANDDSDVPQPVADQRKPFNWIRDSNGLASLFPHSRIMLYDFASAWRGNRKVRATMRSICNWLLDDLKEKRKDGTAANRPLIFIGHSMGGVVVAKTLCIAKSQKEFEAIVTCTVGCLFFGAPFGGSNMAKIALQYSSVFGNDAYESLLSFMRKEKNDTLDEVRSDFMEISNKLEPSIDIFCAFEQVPTDVSYTERIASNLPALLQNNFFKSGARGLIDMGLSAFGGGTHFVEMESATLPGAHNVGITADHRDLVKFESVTSSKFLPVKKALSKMFQLSKTNVRKRTISSGQSLMSHKFVNQVRHSLEGVDMRQRFRSKLKQGSPSSWLTSEPLYRDWLANGVGSEQERLHLWVKGGPGLGKTNASLVAIHHFDRLQAETSAAASHDILLAYFLCDWSTGCCTAEDVLKSLITQMVNLEESLAQHARWFVSNPRFSDDDTATSGAKATATVDNLWKCLQDMIDDPAVNNVHFIISNMHCLESSDSTNALLAKLRENAVYCQSLALAERKAKWLITSRNDKHIHDRLAGRCISVIDLENSDEYGGKVRVARQKHARDAVSQLRSAKGYSADLAYFVRNSIESRSEDERWIDVLCIMLGAKPSSSGNLSIRKWLREVGDLNMHNLVDHAWHAILSQNEDARLELEELLQALTIAYEPPTLADLAVLTRIDDEKRLSELIRKCSPIIRIEAPGEYKDKVIFTNPEFNDRLSTVYFDHANQKKRYHGLMAFRCFEYIKSYRPSDRRGFVSEMSSRSAPVTAHLVDNARVLDLTNEDDESDRPEKLSDQATTFTCAYPIKYLFRHLSEGFPDVANELCDEDPDFWGLDSRLRDEWLKDYQILTTELKDLNAGGMSAVHVAAGIGATEVVSVLVNRNGQEALSWTSVDGMTALHVAALKNQFDVVDKLIRANADIEAGEGGAGTALHFAALRGNCSVMNFLVERGASVNALSQSIGPVINAAIRSGTVDAVNLIMNKDVRFDLDYTKFVPPLSLAAGILEPKLFQDILEMGKEKWLQNVKLLDQALIEASIGGRLESVRTLLNFQRIYKSHLVYTNNTMEKAILRAAEEKHWASVDELLDYSIKDTTEGNRRDVKLDNAFFLAATGREERLDILKKIWTFTNRIISQDVLDFALYQTTVMRKDPTALWLLETCGASANATAESPASIVAEYASAAPLTDFWNVLNAAANSNNAGLVRALVNKGAELDGDRGYALQLAASEGHANVVEVLLEQGAQVNKQLDSSGELGFYSNTALQAACDHGRKDVVKVLIKHGADPNLGGGALTNPITAATQRAQPDILEILLEAPGIDVNVTGGDDQSTPLINAATHLPMESVRLLVDRGADVNALNAVGDTALIMAASKGDQSCVDMLCKAKADVTYRSPNRGLAIQVAAEANPLCAHVLAERMSQTIEVYREQVKNDEMVSRERLDDANAKIEEHSGTIEGLNAVLTETLELLEIANKDIEVQRHEKEKLLSESSYKGATYEHVSQRIKAMENERVELLKQLDSTRGQAELANDTVARVEALFNKEKQTNAALRERQGYVTLQQEKKQAIDRFEAEQLAKKAVEDQLELEQQNTKDARNETLLLEKKLRAMEEKVSAVMGAISGAMDDTEKERVERKIVQGEKEQLQIAVNTLQAHVRTVEAKLASVLEAAGGRSKAGSGGQGIPRKIPSGSSSDLPNGGGGSGSGGTLRNGNGVTDVHGLDNGAPAAFTPSTPPPLTASPQPHVLQQQQHPGFRSPSSSAISHPSSPPANPSANNNNRRISDGNMASSTFRTVHGVHRADGSLGRYRYERGGLMRTRTDSLYDASDRDGEEG